MKKFRPLRIVTWIASAGLVGAAMFVAYIVLFPVNVIDNWELRIAKDKYVLGETVIIESIYKKNVDTTNKSRSSRYLECKNSNGVFVRYLLSEAVADRSKARANGTGVVVVIPDSIAEVELPTDCYFSISISYDVYPRRAEPEYARSQVFILDKPGKSKVQTQATTNSKATAVLPKPSIATEEAKTVKKDPAEPSANPATPTTDNPATQNSLLKTILSPLTNLLGGN